MKTKSILLLGLFSIILSLAACKDPHEDPPHVHQWGEWEVTKPATCSAEGEETRTCVIDGTKDTRVIPIDPDAHDWDESGVTTPPTCTEPGAGARVCKLCGIEESIPALGHDWQWVSTATETEDGTEILTCSRENLTSGSDRTAYATGTTGLEFTLITRGTNEGTYRVSKGAFNGAALHIPAWHRTSDAQSQYLKVTEISNGADTIGSNAFGGTSNISNNTLAAVTFAQDSQINTIGNYAFNNCVGLSGVDIPEGVTSIGNYAFNGCAGLTGVSIPEGVTSIGASAFSGCAGITEMIIPNSVNSIGLSAFSGCTGIVELTIPSTVTSIDNYAFQNWTLAQTINAKHHANQAAADAVWGAGSVNWRTDCYAFIIYGTMPQPFAVTNLDEWNAAVSAIVNGDNNTSHTININGSFNVSGTDANTFGSITGIEVTLTGSGTLTLNSNGSLIRLGAQQSLIIDGDLTLTGRENNNRPLVYVAGAGTALELKNGNITGNESLDLRAHGGGVYVSNGNFTMSGGSITGNICRGIATSRINNSVGEGGGVYVANGNFTMSGGSISGNTAHAKLEDNGNSSAQGGGVCVLSGTFTMLEGTISGNSVLANSSYPPGPTSNKTQRAQGGGVYVSGSFIMLGGTVSGNSASASWASYHIAEGGGVYVAGSSDFFRMVNGIIYGSNASEPQSNIVSIPETMDGTQSGAALYIGYVPAERGIFNGSTWVSKGSLSSSENTVSVLNGDLQ